ncbi:DUF3953 domain-containing protein [Evansella halocellulosilytica]|uniref:DUF3953 domain-containing protein n=1 Tax=Evansella halocellulosilytica TaxID=2011013 RepID=UPI000BB8ED88
MEVNGDDEYIKNYFSDYSDYFIRYSLITSEDRLIPYVILLFGLALLVMGITEIQDKRKVSATINFLFSGMILFLSIMI